MIWVRKGIVLLLSLLLFVTLVGAATSTSFNRTLGQPQKVEAYLAESKIYDHFVAYVADQAKQSEGDNTGAVSLSDVAVQAAAKTSFPSQLIQQGVNAFIRANYAWLEGKVSVPNFRLDLSAQKDNFAKRVGQVVAAYTATLPICTNAQALQEKGVDPLAATCRPKGVKPAAVGAQTTQQLSTTSDFLSNPVITAKAIDPNGNNQSKPYFAKLSKLPKVFQVSQKLPYVFGGLSILFALGIVFIAVTRRRGVRRLGIVLAAAGVILVAYKFAANFALNKAENKVFNKTSVGQIQQSLTDFAHRVVSSMTKIDLWFGIAFILLALIIFGVLAKTRQKKARDKVNESGGPAEPEEPSGRLPLIKARKRLMRPFGDSIMPLGARPGGSEPEPPVASEPGPAPVAKTKRKKKPRLIQ